MGGGSSRYFRRLLAASLVSKLCVLNYEDPSAALVGAEAGLPAKLAHLLDPDLCSQGSFLGGGKARYLDVGVVAGGDTRALTASATGAGCRVLAVDQLSKVDGNRHLANMGRPDQDVSMGKPVGLRGCVQEGENTVVAVDVGSSPGGFSVDHRSQSMRSW